MVVWYYSSGTTCVSLYVSPHRRHDKAHAEGAPMHVSRMTRRTFLSLSGLTAEALGVGSRSYELVELG